jgi:hypothetical protein
LLFILAISLNNFYDFAGGAPSERLRLACFRMQKLTLFLPNNKMKVLEPVLSGRSQGSGPLDKPAGQQRTANVAGGLTKHAVEDRASLTGASIIGTACGQKLCVCQSRCLSARMNQENGASPCRFQANRVDVQNHSSVFEGFI